MLITLLIFLTLSANAFAGEYGKEVRVYDELKGGQATNYLSQKIALEFLNKLLREPGPIKEFFDTHKAKLCGGSSYCGVLNVPSDLCRIAYFRGGWFGGAITYRAILTWSDAGTGSYTYPLLELDIDQDADSEKLGEGKYKTTLTTEITGFKKYDQETFGDQNAIKLPKPPWKVGDAGVPSADSAAPSVNYSVPSVGKNQYLARVEERIDHEWRALPLGTLGTPPPVAVIKFRISRFGEISNIRIDESSGNGNYDSAAKRAVSAVNPLPPFPPDISDSFFEVRFRFIHDAEPRQTGSSGGVKAPFKKGDEIPLKPLEDLALQEKDPVVIADQYFWFGAEGNIGIKLTGKFQSLEIMAETFNLLTERGTFKFRTESEQAKVWKLHEILVSVDFNANGNVATWQVSGPKPLLLEYLKTMRRGYEDKSIFYDFGYEFVNFKPTHYGEEKN